MINTVDHKFNSMIILFNCHQQHQMMITKKVTGCEEFPEGNLFNFMIILFNCHQFN